MKRSSAYTPLRRPPCLRHRGFGPAVRWCIGKARGDLHLLGPEPALAAAQPAPRRSHAICFASRRQAGLDAAAALLELRLPPAFRSRLNVVEFRPRSAELLATRRSVRPLSPYLPPAGSARC